MHIDIIAAGKLKEKHLLEAQKEYSRRIGGYAKLNIIEVPEYSHRENDSAAELEKIKEKEGEGILKKVNPASFVIACDERGEMPSSREFAQKIEKLGIEGKSYITFITGGALGLSKEVLRRADWKLSFSRMTFPHRLVRIILLEQVYRCFKIMRNEPYHK